MIVEKNLKAPPDILQQVEKEADRIEGLLRSKKMRISDAKMDRIESDISKKYEAWKKQTNQLRKRLVRYNDLLEGVVEESNFPFEGSSNITLHYAAGMTRTFRSTFNKTKYADADIAVPVLDPTLEMSAQQFKVLQDGFNYTFNTLYNGIDILKEGTVPCVRDGTLIVSGAWERRLQRAMDQRTYKSAQEFEKDYPTPESAGVDEEGYRSIMDQFILNPDAEVLVNFEYDFVEFDGIEYSINSFAKFVFFPTFAKSIKRMELYGNTYKVSEEEFKIKHKRGDVYERAYEKIKKQKSQQIWDDWDKARISIEGISSNQDEHQPVNLADLVYKADLDEDGIPEKYLVCFAPDQKALCSIQPYPIRRNIDIAVAFRMVSRENRFPGVSLIGDCEDLFNQIDILHRHRNNIRMLTTSPVFIAKKDYKELIDMGRAENVIRPGLTLWVDDINASIKQLELQDLSTNADNMDEEMSLKSYIELVFGPTQGQSGGQTPNDPRAPARKTQMLMMAANARVDDYIDEFDKSLPDLFELHAALLFQYSPQKELSVDRNNQVFKFPIQLLSDPRIKWIAKRRSVQLTPEFAMARLTNLMALYAQLRQLLIMGDQTAIELWNRQVKASGEPESDKLMIDAQNAPQMAQQAQILMMQNIQKQQQIKAQGKGQEKMMGEIGKKMGQHMTAPLEPAKPAEA